MSEIVVKTGFPIGPIDDQELNSYGELGQLLFSHQRSMVMRIVAATIYIAAVSIPIILILAGLHIIGAFVVIIFTAILVYLWKSESGCELHIHSNGIRVKKRGKEESIVWEDIHEVYLSFSYSIDPRALIRMKVKRKKGKSLRLDMNWEDRKGLSVLMFDLFPIPVK